MSTPAVPDNLANAEVISPVHCRRCGYNLYGLRADGLCPECGLAVWETILHTVDPAASRLPKLRSPVAVGNALLWLMICMLVSVVLLIARPLALRIDTLFTTALSAPSALTPWYLPFVAGLVALAGFWAVFRLAPRRGEESQHAVRRDLLLLDLGLFGWALLAMFQPFAETSHRPVVMGAVLGLAMAMAAMVALLGLRGVLAAIGLRSREYRTARGGRQSIQAMVGAIIGIAAGQALRLLAALGGGQGGLATVATVMISICALMLLIGLGYLLVNAWWIRRSLRRPPPTLDRVLNLAAPPDPGTGES